MSKNGKEASEPWAAWAESMQKMMTNPAALNPFAGMTSMGGLMGMPGVPGMPGMAGMAGQNPLDAASLMKAIDPAEIERRINDMRAVETWLKFSLSALEMSIKAMEMQRDAYASLSKMRDSADTTAKAAMASMERAARNVSSAVSASAGSTASNSSARPKARAAKRKK
jgi:hypothetical protein